jgi:6-phosphofructokinase 1
MMENKEIKTIGVLTSGGDAPGMNAAIRAIVRAGIAKGLRVIGIRRGYHGLIRGDMIELSLRSVSDIIHRGGTILYTARSKEFKLPTKVSLRPCKVCRDMGIDGIAVIGGDGSFRGARALSAKGIPCVGLPGTIDNDISSSDYTIGFDTAVNTVKEMVDRLRDTTESHDRCSVVEVMGRKAGYIAVEAGTAVGATSIIIPEIPCDIEKELVPRIVSIQKTGKKNFIILVAEGVGKTDEIAKTIQEKTGIETRISILGHVQRGGSPTVRDRVAASEMGYHTVDLLAQGIGNRVVVMKENHVVDYDIFEALKMEKKFDRTLYDINNTISI